MDFWIVVTLIVLAGALVLLAAASVESAEKHGGAPEPVLPPRDQSPRAVLRKEDRNTVVRCVLFVPQAWRLREHVDSVQDIPGASIVVEEVEGTTLSALATAVESRSGTVRDSVVVIAAGADEFLAGETLDAVLDQIEILLECLSDLPAMAVVASLPDLHTAMKNADPGIDGESMSEIVTVWNGAIAETADAYSAEFADVSAVSVALVGSMRQSPGNTFVAVPNATALLLALRPAICQAVERVRSFRTPS